MDIQRSYEKDTDEKTSQYHFFHDVLAIPGINSPIFIGNIPVNTQKDKKRRE